MTPVQQTKRDSIDHQTGSRDSEKELALNRLGVIDPAQTCDVLGLSIAASLNAPIPDARFGVFRM